MDLDTYPICTGTSGFANFLNSIERCKSGVRDSVLGIAEGNPVSESPWFAGFVVNMFCVSMIDAANEYGIPSYVFYTSSATFLGAMFHLQAQQDVHQHDICMLIKSNTNLDFANPLPKKLLPSEMLTKDVCSMFLSLAKRFKETRGIMVNTFEELDSGVVEHMFHDELPKLYAVGAYTEPEGRGGQCRVGRYTQMAGRSTTALVVFLCFRSAGSCREDQSRSPAPWRKRPPVSLVLAPAPSGG